MITLKLHARLISCVILSLFLTLASGNTNSIETAKSLAKASGKNIFVNYTAAWCLPCQIFEEHVLENQKVSKLLSNDFIVLTADYDDPQSLKLFGDYSIACMPTVHVLDAKGSVLNDISGTMSVEAFINELTPYKLKRTSSPFVEQEKSEAFRPIPVASNITKKPNRIKEFYTLQAGAFSNWDNAINLKQKIEKLFAEPVSINENTERKLFIIYVGEFYSKEELLSISYILKDAGIDHFVKRKREISAMLDKGI